MITTVQTRSRLFLAYSGWDIIPVLAGAAHLAYLIGVFLLFDRLSWWGVILAGLGYAYLIAWDINSVSHNFIHNPYFVSPALNRAYDPISTYRYGRNGESENVWAYTFKSYLREDPVFVWRAIAKRSPADARFALVELAVVIALAAAIPNWRCMLAMLPFYCLGRSLSSLNGFYERYRGNPDLPIAWGASNCGGLLQLGMAERRQSRRMPLPAAPAWTEMKKIHREIALRQQEARVRVINWPITWASWTAIKPHSYREQRWA